MNQSDVIVLRIRRWPRLRPSYWRLRRQWRRERRRPRGTWLDLDGAAAEIQRLRQQLDVPHGTPVDDQPAAAEQRQLPHVGAEHGGLHPHGVDRRAGGVGEVDLVGDVVDDESHHGSVERTFERGE